MNNLFSLNGKVAIVTGAASGIGKGIARQFALAGADVMLNDLLEKELQQVAKELSVFGAKVETVTSDFFNKSGREKILSATIEKFGNSDILVCNPYKSIQKPALEWTDEDLQSILDADLVAHFSMARMFAQRCKQKGHGGVILFISSEFGTMDMVRRNSLGYDLAKAAIVKMVNILAKEWLSYGIRVNAIAPGATNTPGERNFTSEEELRKSWSQLPAGRPCSPEEIGMEAVAIIANPMINGETRRINAAEHLICVY